ncbi:MAG: prepilin-type N-terminal cleavage/methylation domain-containing protein, partial [Phycisphaerales bacterium]|nr:prepilin-type N-terminal cleavage/methylation domain-containing protein [Phycisphaerales bacterium]
MRRSRYNAAGFTLIEILVSVAVLVVVILVCGKAFQAASSVARVGEASGSVLQDAWAIGRQIREDLSRISPDGALIIHSVEVPNDYNQQHWDDSRPGGRPGLINPALPREAVVRCDQLMFFMGGIEMSVPMGANLYNVSRGGAAACGGSSSAVTYGHALQFAELSPYSAYDYTLPGTPDPIDSPLGDLPPHYKGHDIDFDDVRTGTSISPSSGLETSLCRMPPFYRSNVTGDFESGGWGGQLEAVYSHYGYVNGATNESLYQQSDPVVDRAREIRGDQPEARKWLLSRRLAILADDDSGAPNEGTKRIYNSSSYAIESLYPIDPRRVNANTVGFQRRAAVLDMGRVDMVGMHLSDIRKSLLHSRDGNDPDRNFARRPWSDRDDDGIPDDVNDGTHLVIEGNSLPGLGTQRHLLKTLLAWPRAERRPPGPTRFDQALSNTVIGVGCSSFIVEWTWDDNVGETRTWEELYLDRPVTRRDRVTWQGFRFDPADEDYDPASGDQLQGTDVRQQGDQFWFGLPDKRLPTDVDDAWDRGV